MRAAPWREDEAGAVEALGDLHLLDGAADEEIDAIAAVAATVCEAPLAQVRLVDAERRWFKAAPGPTTPKGPALCEQVVRAGALLEVPDVWHDDRFADHPQWTGAQGVRFYAGAPVIVQGRCVGALSVTDQRPRQLTPSQHGALCQLATAVGKALEARASTRQLQEQLQASRERERMTRLVLDAVPSLMSYWGADLRCRFANQAHLRWHGRAPDDIVGTHLQQFLGLRIFEENASVFRRVLDGETFEFERSVTCADGVRREAILFYIPDVVDGRVVGFLAQLTDVTLLKASTEALQREKADMQRVMALQDRTARLLNDAQRLGRIGSWEADLASGVTIWSEEMFRITGRNPSLPPPLLEDRFADFVPESGERLKQASALCLESGLPYVLELEFPHGSTGELRWLETRGDVVRDGSGTVVGMRGTIQDITDRKRLASKLAQQHELARVALLQLQQVTDNLPALISYLDTDERFRFANQLHATWLGRAPQQLIGTRLVDLCGQAIYDHFKRHVHLALQGEQVHYTSELPTLLGQRHVEVSLVPDIETGGRVAGVFVMMIDVTARRDAEVALKHSEHRLRMVADNMPALVAYLDHEERYRFVNHHHGEVFQVPAAQLLGRTMRETAGARLYQKTSAHVAAALRGKQVTFDGTWTRDGRRHHYQSTYVPDVDDAGTVRGFYAMTFDITALKETQRRLDALARVDPLTELPNRRQFDERLQEAMAGSRRTGVPMALLFLDVDHFKRINDTFGHGVGDKVLKAFADRLRREVRRTDLVARLAGDEFVVLLEGIRQPAEVEALGQKIVRSIRHPIALDDGSFVHVTTSVGITLFDGDERTAVDVLAAADRALYQAKHGGRDGFALATGHGAGTATPAVRRA